MKKIIKEWKWFGMGLVVVLVLALVLRVYHLTLLPVFADEAIYIRWSQIMASEPTLRFLPLSDGKQPLYMWVLMFLVRRFSDPLFVGRLVSALAGMGTVLGVMGVSYLLFKSKRSALVTGFLWAMSPFALFFDRLALVDSLLASLTAWTLFLGILTVKTRRFDMAILTGFALGFAALTKSSAIFTAGLLVFVWILGDFEKKKQRRLRVIWAGFLMMVIYSIALAMYNIQRLGPNFHLLASRTRDYMYSMSHLWTNPMDPFIPYFDRAGEWLVIMGPSMLVVLGLLGVFGGRKYGREKLVLLAWFLGPVVVQAALAKTFTARYIFFTLPPLFVLAGNALENKGGKRIAVGLALSVFVAQAVIFDYKLLTNIEEANLPRSERSGYLEEWTAGTGIYEAGEFLKLEARKSSTQIIVGTEGYFGTLPDGLQMYMDGVASVTVIGVGLDFKETPVQLVEAVGAGSRAYLLANTSRVKWEEIPDGLELVAEWPKAVRPHGREYVQYGERDYLQLWELVGE